MAVCHGLAPTVQHGRCREAVVAQYLEGDIGLPHAARQPLAQIGQQRRIALQGQLARHHDHGIGRRLGGLAGHRRVPAHAGDVHDAALDGILLHVLGRLRREDERRLRVDVEHVVPQLIVAVEEPAAVRAARRVDEAVDAPEEIARLAEHPKLVGLRPMIQNIADDDWMLKPALAPAFEAMIRHDLTFDALVLPRHLPRLPRPPLRHRKRPPRHLRPQRRLLRHLQRELCSAREESRLSRRFALRGRTLPRSAEP